MTASIKKIAILKSGVFAKPTGQGDAVYLQASHFDTNGKFDERVKSNLEVTQRLRKELLTKGDILFSSKGSRNFAVVYDGDIGPAVASTTFIVLRISPAYQQEVLPEYLSWFMNQPLAQNRMKALAKGTFIPSITMKALGDLAVDVPDLEKQRLILKISALRNEERHLYAKIEELREQLIQGKLINIAHH